MKFESIDRDSMINVPHLAVVVPAHVLGKVEFQPLHNQSDWCAQVFTCMSCLPNFGGDETFHIALQSFLWTFELLGKVGIAGNIDRISIFFLVFFVHFTTVFFVGVIPLQRPLPFTLLAYRTSV